MSKLIPLNLQFFAENGGEQGDQQADNQAGGQDDQLKDTGDQHDDKDNTKVDKPEEKLYKQEDVNNIAAREAKKAQEKLLKQLGIEDFKSAKEGLEKFREWQESQKTDAEKQAEALKALEAEKGTLSDENATLKAQLSAVKAGVNADSVEDVVVLAKNLVNDDVDMDEAIKQVVEKYPHFANDAGEKKEEPEKPRFTTGHHQKQQPTELEKWLNAFK